MESKLKLVAAVLFTMAALAWGFNLYQSLQNGAGAWPTILVVLTFAVASIVYWVAYFRSRTLNGAKE